MSDTQFLDTIKENRVEDGWEHPRRPCSFFGMTKRLHSPFPMLERYDLQGLALPFARTLGNRRDGVMVRARSRSFRRTIKGWLRRSLR